MGSEYSEQREYTYVADMDKGELLGIKEAHARLIDQTKLVEDPRILVAVDFSHSNFMSWGSLPQGATTSLHQPSYLKRGHQLYKAQAPYRRALEMCTYAVRTFTSSSEFLFLGFNDSIFHEQKVTRTDVLHVYDQIVEKFVKGQQALPQQAGTNIANLIYRASKYALESQSFTILLILTDGDSIDLAQANQAISDASNFPVSVVTVGIGERSFGAYAGFDDAMFDRKFDNFSLFLFPYFTVVQELDKKVYHAGPLACLSDREKGKDEVPEKPAGDIDLFGKMLFELGCFSELAQQYSDVSQMGYLEVVRLAK